LLTVLNSTGPIQHRRPCDQHCVQIRGKLVQAVDKTMTRQFIHTPGRLITARSQELAHPGSPRWTCHLPRWSQIPQRLLLLL